MSEYGRLWQQVSDIRSRIKELVPGVTLNTLNGAHAELAARTDLSARTSAHVNVLLVGWARLETMMEHTEE